MIALLCATLALSASRALFTSAGWPALRQKLDSLPVFTCANEEGQPLQYEVEGNPSAMFYASLEDAQRELASSREMFPTLAVDLIPVGLGNAFQLSCEGKAQLVPGTAELTAAGAPAGAQVMGQQLPLFACMEMSQPGPGGAPQLPLFMSYADCAAAVSQATAVDNPEEKLEIVGLSLDSVCERLQGQQDGAFAFVPPSRSLEFIREYLENSGGLGVKSAS